MGNVKAISKDIALVAEDLQKVMSLNSNSTITSPLILQMQGVSGVRTTSTNTMLNVVFFLGILSI